MRIRVIATGGTIDKVYFDCHVSKEQTAQLKRQGIDVSYQKLFSCSPRKS